MLFEHQANLRGFCANTNHLDENGKRVPYAAGDTVIVLPPGDDENGSWLWQAFCYPCGTRIRNGSSRVVRYDTQVPLEING